MGSYHLSVLGRVAGSEGKVALYTCLWVRWWAELTQATDDAAPSPISLGAMIVVADDIECPVVAMGPTLR